MTVADWPAIKREYETTTRSVRSISRTFGCSNTAIHKRAEAEGWVRPAIDAETGGDRLRRMARPRVNQARSRTAKPPALPATIPEHLQEAPEAPQQVKTIITNGHDLALRMLGELDDTTSCLGEIEKLIIEETRDDRDGKRRHAMLQAVGLPGRAMTLRNLATAAKTFADAITNGGPGGKKGAREDAAKDAARGKFATPAAPKVVVDNTR